MGMDLQLKAVWTIVHLLQFGQMFVAYSKSTRKFRADSSLIVSGSAVEMMSD